MVWTGVEGYYYCCSSGGGGEDREWWDDGDDASEGGGYCYGDDARECGVGSRVRGLCAGVCADMEARGVDV